jgi:long-subunit acyl-CoA synthetase (AMP-forming)
MDHHLKSDIALTDVTKNIGTMFLNNRDNFGDMNAFAMDESGEYCYWTWNQLVDDICTFAAYLQSKGLQKGDHIGIISRNYYHRLVVELAVMASGYVSVPIFHRYTEEMMSHLLEFSDIKMLILVNYWRLEYLPHEDKPLVVMETPEFPKKEFPFTERVEFFDDIMKDTVVSPEQRKEIEQSFRDVDPSEVCLIMFTSGTTRFPKGVILTHSNIMTQQSALRELWKPEPGMRFLCYLPWHHSFGGLFERFFALHSGGCLAVDGSWGKDITKLFKNFSIIKPHIYFSVPKVYKEIISKVLTSEDAASTFFHDELKFIFTAAAPLDLSISDIFKKMNIPVVEGWGLTETSPCCTLTDLLLDRTPGFVGHPIPGVEVKLGDENEILVRGVNVMKGYYKLPAVTEAVLDDDGWFKTGDIGAVTEDGVQILARKDRVFKLSNGEKVFPSQIERNIGNLCKFIKHAYIFGTGQDHPYALLFPNRELLDSDEISILDEAECVHPDEMGSLNACFSRCLHKINCHQNVKFEHIEKAILIDQDLTLEKDELTPSFKIIARNIEKNYEDYIKCMMNNDFKDLPENARVVEVCDCDDCTDTQDAKKK